MISNQTENASVSFLGRN